MFKWWTPMKMTHSMPRIMKIIWYNPFFITLWVRFYSNRAYYESSVQKRVTRALSITYSIINLLLVSKPHKHCTEAVLIMSIIDRS